tara:strand:- start:856 stop:1056 length:201 start_codon:yes stop_codon:yes gene_type:complete
MDFIRETLYKQNNTLLKQIAEDFYPNMLEEQETFIYKYNKKNFTYMQPVNKDITNLNEKRLKKVLK